MRYDEKWMREAIRLAREKDSIYGAVIICDDKVVASGVNLTEELRDATCHAEMVAIREASKRLNSKKLSGCILYTTCEPCAMCTSAAIWSRCARIAFGATIDDLVGLVGKRQIAIEAAAVTRQSSPTVEVVGGVLRKECLALFNQ